MKKTLSTIITIAFCLNLSGQQITQQFNMKNLLLLLIFFSLLSCGNQNAMQSETSDMRTESYITKMVIYIKEKMGNLKVSYHKLLMPLEKYQQQKQVII